MSSTLDGTILIAAFVIAVAILIHALYTRES